MEGHISKLYLALTTYLIFLPSISFLLLFSNGVFSELGHLHRNTHNLLRRILYVR